MAAKEPRRSSKKVQSLKAKSLTGKKAKGVKGGIIVVCRDLEEKWSPTLTSPSEFGLKR